MEGSYVSNLLQSAPGRAVRPVLPPRKKSGCGCRFFLCPQVNELLLLEICLRSAVWWRGENWVVCQESWKCATALLLTGCGKSQKSSVPRPQSSVSHSVNLGRATWWPPTLKLVWGWRRTMVTIPGGHSNARRTTRTITIACNCVYGSACVFIYIRCVCVCARSCSELA